MSTLQPTQTARGRPQFGRRLLLELITERANDHHSRPYASIPRNPNDITDGYEDVSYEQFANAINRCARWLLSHEEFSASEVPLVYAGPNDLRYQILSQAAVKTDNIIFFISPRNSTELQLALLEQAQTNRIIVPADGEPPLVNQVAKLRSIERFTLPTLSNLLDQEPVTPVPFHKSWRDLRMEPWIMVHTSGSTGTPKIVTIRHGYTTTIDAQWMLPQNEVAQRVGECRLFAPFPAFHIAGIIYSMMVAPFVDSTLVFPPSAPLTAGVLDCVHVYGNVEHSSIPPPLIVELAKNEEYLDNLKQLRGLTFAGGPLSGPVGDMLCQHVALHTALGATELGSLPMKPTDREDWAYFNFNAGVAGIEFVETGHEGLYELVVLRMSHLSLFQAAFITFPDENEYHTKDLFSKHPTKSGLWRYECRLDDIIALSSGEKVNPVTMEGVITSCPDVQGCVVFGQGQSQTGLLIEPATYPNTTEKMRDLLKAVEPYIEQANEGCVTHAKISADLVILTKEDRPLPRAAKGTVQRSKANSQYQEEIDHAYQSLEEGGNGPALEPEREVELQLDLTSTPVAEAALMRYLQTRLGNTEIGRRDNILALGVDSLEAVRLVRELNKHLETSRPIEVQDIYEHPTINELVAFLQGLETLDRRDSDEVNRETWSRMEDTYQEATKELPDSKPEPDGVKGSQAPIRTDSGTTAWLQVLASFLINLNTWGLANSWGAFQAYLESNQLSGRSPDSIAWIGTLMTALLLIGGVLSGPIFDLGLFAPVMVGASLGVVVGLVLLSLATQYYQIMLLWGVVIGISTGLLYIPSVSAIPLYFKKRQGLALGLGTGGGSIGGVIYPILVRRVIDSSGFAWAARAVALVALVTLAAAALIVRPVNQGARKPLRRLFDRRFLTDVPFAAFMAAAFFLFVGMLVPFVLTPVFARQGLDSPADQSTAFYLLAVPNAAQFLGRVIPGHLSDSQIVAPELLLGSANFACAVLSLAWIGVSNMGGFAAFLALYGFFSGIVTALPPVVAVCITPDLSTLGTRLGMLYGAAGLGALVGTPIALATSKTLSAGADGFLGAQIWTGMSFLAGAIVFVITAYEARYRRLALAAGSRYRDQEENRKRFYDSTRTLVRSSKSSTYSTFHDSSVTLALGREGAAHVHGQPQGAGPGAVGGYQPLVDAGGNGSSSNLSGYHTRRSHEV